MRSCVVEFVIAAVVITFTQRVYRPEKGGKRDYNIFITVNLSELSLQSIKTKSICVFPAGCLSSQNFSHFTVARLPRTLRAFYLRIIRACSSIDPRRLSGLTFLN